ncbi:hypothetical protein SAV14893_044980 [Streptomyces avermitilis]|uniref:Uncharacterized protein n=1 Tax=Streptomyces avermitilis TaxID=33903 RepID=A0A4D4MRA5_STRAX|nr:hypothetical protein SAVMC3_57160 [Streptomyces avermitilis]GDY65105.1 hypothetical protein SAV14893_044980 [Streptomyces avermitilis]GDY74690.1 hypothetical protein SAV31267_041750 [Streptomyces avermitilis]GDY83730.1 hypothetical protein SAVCW2_29290 [Streptomyces avermitilis]
MWTGGGEPSPSGLGASPRAGVNGGATHPVRTYEAAEQSKPWNERAVLPVSMDIRTDQGHLGKVS